MVYEGLNNNLFLSSYILSKVIKLTLFKKY